MSTGQTGRIYWANAGAQAVSCANLDGTEARDVCSASESPWALTVDRRNEKLWFTVPALGAFCWIELDGSTEPGLQRPGAVIGPMGMAMSSESSSSLLYWSGAIDLGYGSPDGIYCSEVGGSGIGQNWIESEENGLLAFDPPATLYCAVGDRIVCLDVSTVPSPILGEIRTPRPVGGVAVDASSGILYSTNIEDSTNGEEARIEKHWLETKDSTVLTTPGATVAGPSGIAVDAKAERVYWTNWKGGPRETGAISWAHCDGTGGGDIEITGATIDAPCGIALLMAPSVEALPTISGGAIVGGEPLQCDPGSCAPDETGGLVFRDANETAYQWRWEGELLQGETAPTLAPQQGGYYTCAVTYVNPVGATVAEPAPHYVQKQS